MHRMPTDGIRYFVAGGAMPEQLILIAFIQGITEFLPISSSGHLNLLHGLGFVKDHGLAMDVAVHIGTVFAVIAYNHLDIKRMALSFLSLGRHFPDYFGVSMSAFVATIPVIIAGFYLNGQPHMLELLRHVEIIAWATLIFGILLGVADMNTGRRRLNTIHIGDAVLIGIAQCLALIPGTSRAGITMTAARAVGIAPRAAARFSMILSIPVILGSGVLKGFDLIQDGNTDAWIGMIIAALIAMVVAFLSIHVMLTIIQRIGFMPFVIYRVLLGAGLLAMVYI